MKVGDEVEAVVLTLDREERTLSLIHIYPFIIKEYGIFFPELANQADCYQIFKQRCISVYQE